MKNLKSMTTLTLALLVVLSCDDRVTEIMHPKNGNYNRWDDSGTITPLFDGSDAGPIDPLIAQSWLRNFTAQNARTLTSEHYFHRDAFEQILSQEGCTGIRVYYATGDLGLIFVVTAVDGEGKNILASEALLIVSDRTLAQQAQQITYDDAHNWVDNYASMVEESAIKSHYFGRDGIDELLRSNECAGLRVYQAISEAGYDKLLLAGVTLADGFPQDAVTGTRSIISSRSHDQGPPVILDFSFPCPSTCPNGYGLTL